MSSFGLILKRKNNFFIVTTYRQIGHPIMQSKRVAIFLDNSKFSLKCVLLRNGNRYEAIPVGYSTVLKKD